MRNQSATMRHFWQSLIVLVTLAAYLSFQSFVTANNVLRASCVIHKNSGVGPIEGTMKFSQKVGENVPTTLNVQLSGFDRASTTTQHGFHVHAHGGLGNKCNDAGGHFNPFNLTHGSPADPERHVGDLGNIIVAADGTVTTTLTDRMISLADPYSVLNRAIVVHALADDLGRGGFNDSKTTGHAGARLGCCLIVTDEDPPKQVSRRRAGRSHGRKGSRGRKPRGSSEFEKDRLLGYGKCRGH